MKILQESGIQGYSDLDATARIVERELKTDKRATVEDMVKILGFADIVLNHPDKTPPPRGAIDMTQEILDKYSPLKVN